MDDKQKDFDYETEIWNVADYVWGPINTSEFNKVILPFTMLRRLECALEPTRDAVSKAYEEHPEWWNPVDDTEEKREDLFCMYSQMPFFNVTPFRLNDLGSTDTFDALMKYINGFSSNAREILNKFRIEETCRILDENDLLYGVCTKFAKFNLSPEAVSDRDMSNIYEHLIQRFGESIAEKAEDYMTPRDVVRLAVGMIFANDDELMNSDTGIIRTLYDPTMGTAGFITDAMDQLDEWHDNKKMIAPAKIVPYGQECESVSWAMSKTALLLRSVGKKDADAFDSISDLSANLMLGNTLTEDKFEGKTFDYILSNPPYGKKWENEKSDVMEEAKLGFAGRFGAGTPSVEDGSMLFMQHVVSKMKPAEEGGGKAGIVLSASPLFNGSAGSGPSNIRRWLFEKDVVDCIVKLPEAIFYRTGINTYLWIFNNNKPEERKGMIQLIDASDQRTPLNKSQGNKRFEIDENQREWIIKTYIDGHDHGNSVIVPYETFMYRQVTTQRPLRAALSFTSDTIKATVECNALKKLSDANKDILRRYMGADIGGENIVPYDKAETTAKAARDEMDKPEVGATDIAKAIRANCIVKCQEYPVIKDKNGDDMPDPDLKDYENIPFGIDFSKYMKDEVLPYTSDAWIDENVIDNKYLKGDNMVGIVGTNINFNKFFYAYNEPRDPKEIAEEIKNITIEIDKLTKELLL